MDTPRTCKKDFLMSRTLISGASLIELLYCLAIFSALLLATPDFLAWLERNQQQALRNELLSTIQAARAYSILHNQSVEICGSSNGLNCDQSWSQGWLIRLPADGTILRNTRLEGHHQLIWSRASVLFQSDGMTTLSNGRFTLCDESGSVAWQLVLNRQGRTRSVAGLDESHPPPPACLAEKA